MANYLSEHDIKYLHRFAEIHDERKALSEVFGAYTPLKRHDEIMAKPLARKKFNEIVDNAVKDIEKSSSASLKRLMNIQSANLSDFIDLRTGDFKDDIPKQYMDAIKSVNYDAKTGAVTQITLVDKLKAIETSLKFTGMLNKKIDVSVNLSITEQLASSTVGNDEVDGFIQDLLGKPKEENVIEVEEVETDEKE